MRGVILAGGTGSRLLPMTRVTNKHLLPVYDRPMIFWPLQVLLANNIRDIMVISGLEHLGDVVRTLGSGAQFDCRFTFRAQDQAGGIAEALLLAEDFCRMQDEAWPFHMNVVILGDTILHPVPRIERLEAGKGARVYLAGTKTPEAYGVPLMLAHLLEGTASIERIVEKPQDAAGIYTKAVIGLYVYDAACFNRIKTLQRSARGELEITDLNNIYAAEGRLGWENVPGYWGDAGTVDGLMDAARVMQDFHDRLLPIPLRKTAAVTGDWRRDGPPSNAPVGG